MTNENKTLQILIQTIHMNLQELSETKKIFRMIFVSDKSMLMSSAWKFYSFALLSAFLAWITISRKNSLCRLSLSTGKGSV